VDELSRLSSTATYVAHLILARSALSPKFRPECFTELERVTTYQTAPSDGEGPICAQRRL
jgi:hypothetical protein